MYIWIKNILEIIKKLEIFDTEFTRKHCIPPIYKRQILSMPGINVRFSTFCMQNTDQHWLLRKSNGCHFPTV